MNHLNLDHLNLGDIELRRYCTKFHVSVPTPCYTKYSIKGGFPTRLIEIAVRVWAHQTLHATQITQDQDRSRHSSRLPSLQAHPVSTTLFAFKSPHAITMASKNMFKARKSDIESQKGNRELSRGPGKITPCSEYRVPTTTKFAYLGIYFLCNVSLTIYNKLVLGKV
jgi:hypothetical protein